LTTFVLLCWSVSGIAQFPGLGVVLSDEEVAAIDFTVLPDGAGLPAGTGDAVTGEALYQQHCLACHGKDGQGGLNDRLVGGVGTIDSAAPVKTVGSYWPYATTLYDYIRRAMPYHTPDSLDANEIYALSAYLLFKNGVIDQREEINERSLPQVKMPNRDGFRWAVPSD
jgi:cytochrome c